MRENTKGSEKVSGDRERVKVKQKERKSRGGKKRGGLVKIKKFPERQRMDRWRDGEKEKGGEKEIDDEREALV